MQRRGLYEGFFVAAVGRMRVMRCLLSLPASLFILLLGDTLLVWHTVHLLQTM